MNFSRIYFLVSLGIFFIQQTHAQKISLSIHKLTADFHVFTTWQSFKGSFFPSNGMYVVTSKGVIMVDTPWDSTQFQPLLDSIQARHGKKVIVCIATHWHDDRSGGLEFYRRKGIATYATLRTDLLAQQHGEKRAEFMITKDTLFRVGQYAFQLYYPGVGHTPDNIVIWFAKQKILYGGCLIKSEEAKDLGNTADADIRAWARSIHNVRERFGKAAYIVPGHQTIGNDRLIDHTLELIREELEKEKEDDEEKD